MCGHDVLIYERLSYIYIHITPLTAYSKEEGYSLRSRHQMQEDHQSVEVNVPSPLLLYIYIYVCVHGQPVGIWELICWRKSKKVTHTKGYCYSIGVLFEAGSTH